MSAKSALESLLAKRAVSRTGAQPAPMVWAREELWKLSPQLAAEVYENGHVFTHTLVDGTSVSIAEDSSMIGTRVWDGGLLLASALQINRSWLPSFDNQEPLRVLELGCGTGIVGMVAARVFAGRYDAPADQRGAAPPTASESAQPTVARARIALTDIPAVVAATQKHLQANGFSSSSGPVQVSAMPLTWGHVSDEDGVLAWLGGRPNLVIVCDAAAPAAVAPDLVGTITRMMPRTDASPAPLLLLCVQLHREFTQPLLDGLRSGGFILEPVPSSELHQQYLSDKHVVYRVQPS